MCLISAKKVFGMLSVGKHLERSRSLKTHDCSFPNMRNLGFKALIKRLLFVAFSEEIRPGGEIWTQGPNKI